MNMYYYSLGQNNNISYVKSRWQPLRPRSPLNPPLPLVAAVAVADCILIEVECFRQDSERLTWVGLYKQHYAE